MNIKKQLRNLYLYEIISGFQIVDAVWVLFLLGRGFSLTQAGLAEGFFHMVSMCCEIPSGMLSGYDRTAKNFDFSRADISGRSFLYDCYRLVLGDFNCYGSECV